jgi:hypothetical protein
LGRLLFVRIEPQRKPFFALALQFCALTASIFAGRRLAAEDWRAATEDLHPF